LKKRLLFIALLGGYVQRTQAQNTLSLQDSWQKAMQKSVAMKQKQTDVDAARTEVQLTERLRLPTVSGQYNNSLNVGRSIDPYTNTFSSQRIVGNTYGVSANYTVFDNKQLANQLANQNAQFVLDKLGV
jgi:outer membrane protein